MPLAAISTGSGIAIGLIVGVVLALLYWSRSHAPAPRDTGPLWDGEGEQLYPKDDKRDDAVARDPGPASVGLAVAAAEVPAVDPAPFGGNFSVSEPAGPQVTDFAYDLLPEHYRAEKPPIAPAHEGHEVRTPEIKPEPTGPDDSDDFEPDGGHDSDSSFD